MATKRLDVLVEPMRDVHVVPHYDGWATKRDGGVRVSRLADSQEDAIEVGKRIAKRDKVNLVVYDTGGHAQLRCSYGATLTGDLMQASQLQQRVERIEQCTDDAVNAIQRAGADAPDDLRQCVAQMHEQARDLRVKARQSGDQAQLTDSVDNLEQTGDRAKAACRSAVGRIDPQLQSAVIKAHDEIADLKKQMH